VRLQVLVDGFAKPLVILQCLDLLDLPKRLKGIVIEIVHLADVWVGHDDIGQLLHVPNAMSYSMPSLSTLQPYMGLVKGCLPGRKLRPDVVGRTDQPRLGERTTKDH
jgi:hypothetical protein